MTEIRSFGLKISEMKKKKYDEYIKNFKRNNKIIMISQLIKKKNYKLIYSHGFKNFNSLVLRKFSKECIKIINEKKVNLSLKKLKLINF